MSKRWSSYRRQQVLMENFRKFLTEEESEETLQEDSGEEEGEHYRRNKEEDEKHLKALKTNIAYDNRHIKREGYGKMPPMDRDDEEAELDEAHCNTKAKRDDVGEGEEGDDDQMKGRDSLDKPGHIDYEKGKIGGKTV